MVFRALPRTRLLAPATLLACAVVFAGAQSASAASVSSARSLDRARASTAAPGHFRFFAPTGIWNARLADGAPLDPSSSSLIKAFQSEVSAEQSKRVGPWINTSRYSVPIYTVPADQPTVRVRLTSPQPAPSIQAAFEQVPLPPDAVPSGGTDGNLVVWQPSRDRLWEFWRLVRTADGPEASWGGAIQDVSSNPGVYGPDAWPGAKTWWGASATSLPIAGGLITVEDLRLGEIDHALALAIPAVRGGVFASPAQRSDGKSTNPRSLPEGAHLRLDPSLDIATLHLPRTTRLIAEAAQRYGIYVRDGSSVIQFFAQDPVNLGGNPYTERDGFFEGRYPDRLLASFPWQRLQLLKMELHPDT
jgi:hypothetical protein